MVTEGDGEGEHDVVVDATVMSVAVGTDEGHVEEQFGTAEDCWLDSGGGGGGGKGGGGGRLEESESVAVLEVSRDSE